MGITQEEDVERSNLLGLQDSSCRGGLRDFEKRGHSVLATMVGRQRKF